MNKNKYLSLFLVAPFVIAQLILAPVAAGALMLRGIFSDNPRKTAESKYAITTKLALISNKS
jgi:hypothetical protein